MKNYKFKINNLDCANCANMIETKLNKDKNLSDVNINFSKATITFKVNENIKTQLFCKLSGKNVQFTFTL